MIILPYYADFFGSIIFFLVPVFVLVAVYIRGLIILPPSLYKDYFISPHNTDPSETIRNVIRPGNL